MPRLLLVSPVFPPARGGIETIAGRLAAMLTEHEVHVVALAEPGDAEFDATAPFAVTRVPNEPRGGRGAVVRLNVAAVRTGLRWRPDVTLSMHVNAAPAANALRRLRAVPSVQYVHAKEVRQLPYVAAAAIRHAAGTIAVSSYAQALALDVGADPARLHLIHPGVTLPAPTAQPVTRAAEPTIVTVSRLEDRNKGHDVVLDALPEIARHVPDVRWIVIGDGPLRPALEAQAAERGVADRVTFVGAVDDAQRDGWLDRAWLYVMPTRQPADGRGGEGFGMVYVEAAAHGTPAVGSRLPGVEDAVLNGTTGLLVAPDAPAEVAEAVTRLLTEDEERERFAAAARARAADLAWEHVVPRVGAVLAGAAGAPSRTVGPRGRLRSVLWPADLVLPLRAPRPFAGPGPGRAALPTD